MAVTSIWPYKNTVRKCIDYVMNPDKTNEENWQDFHKDSKGQLEFSESERDEAVYLISGIGGVDCSTVDNAALDFQLTKEAWDKCGGRQCYHGYQSFAAGEITPEIAHEIGVRLAQTLWGNRFQVIVATHVNTEHIHNHFVINSVSISDGYKFYNSPEDYQAMRSISDELCLEYGLSVVLEPSAEGVKNWRKEKAGKVNIRNEICRDIDDIISRSNNIYEFYDKLKESGYELKVGNNIKYPALSPSDSFDQNGKRRFFRFKNLCPGDGYTIEDIAKRISDPEYDRSIIAKEQFFSGKKNEYTNQERKNKTYYVVPSWHTSGINPFWKQKRSRPFYHSYFMYRYYKYLDIMRRQTLSQSGRYRTRISPELRQDARKLELISKSTLFIAKYGIKSTSDVMNKKFSLQLDIAKLTKERQRLWRIGNKDEAQLLTARIKALRQEVNICNYIIESNDRVKAVTQNYPGYQRNLSSNPEKDSESRDNR